MGTRLILASQSRARREMLAAAGLAFELAPSGVDEIAARAAMPAGLAAIDVARGLAQGKAEAVSRQYPNAVVVGADQVLALGDEIFEKPPDLAAARHALLRLRGRIHQLHSAVVIAEGGRADWVHADTASLLVRPFTDAFLDGYLAAAGERLLGAVGAYELEGRGVQLFDRIEGDYFTILGMPLIALLGALRERGAVAA